MICAACEWFAEVVKFVKFVKFVKVVKFLMPVGIATIERLADRELFCTSPHCWL